MFEFRKSEAVIAAIHSTDKEAIATASHAIIVTPGSVSREVLTKWIQLASAKKKKVLHFDKLKELTGEVYAGPDADTVAGRVVAALARFGVKVIDEPTPEPETETEVEERELVQSEIPVPEE